LLDAAVLAERATAAGMVGLQHPQALFQRYERQRRGEILALLAATDTLNQLFLARAPWLGWLRHAGLALTHRLEPLKRLLMAHAMGESGDLPALARPAASELF
jgi:2-polyprenyl-6-methoxyphenol hydroxylase-like FAD-dependent oxidoreductase